MRMPEREQVRNPAVSQLLPCTHPSPSDRWCILAERSCSKSALKLVQTIVIHYLSANKMNKLMIRYFYEIYLLCAIPMVSLDQHHLLSHVFTLFDGTETDDITDTRIRLLASVSDPHAAADGDVEAAQLSLLIDDSNKAKIVGEYVDVIARRHCHSNFELLTVRE
jgi:hypothetical protein